MKKKLKTKSVTKEKKIFVGIKSYSLGHGRWGIGPVYKKEKIEEDVPRVCLYNLAAVIYNAVLVVVGSIRKEVI